jgi:type III restriction enzyme
LDHSDKVKAWVKNDHLGFEIVYLFKGVFQKYRPDFIIRLANGEHLILETKGQETERDKAKRSFLDEWVEAINHQGGFGKWKAAVSKHPDDVPEILHKAGA